MRLEWALRALRAASNKNTQTMAAKATDTIAIIRVLSRLGTEVADSTGGAVATGLLAVSAGAAGGCDSFATGAATAAAAGFSSG